MNPIVKNIIARMVLSNPDHRPTAEELLDHPWLKGRDLSTTETEPNSPEATIITQIESTSSDGK